MHTQTRAHRARKWMLHCLRENVQNSRARAGKWSHPWRHTVRFNSSRRPLHAQPHQGDAQATCDTEAQTRARQFVRRTQQRAMGPAPRPALWAPHLHAVNPSSEFDRRIGPGGFDRRKGPRLPPAAGVPPRPPLQDWNGRQAWDSDRRVTVNNIQVMLVRAPR